MGRIDRRFVQIDGFAWSFSHEELPPWQRRFLYRKLPRHKYQIHSYRRPLHRRALFLAERRARMALGTSLVMTPTVRLQDGIYVVLSCHADGTPSVSAPWSDLSPGMCIGEW
jgi:hypothetical protein